MDREELKRQVESVMALVEEHVHDVDFILDLDRVLEENIQAIFDQKAEDIQKKSTVFKVTFILYYGIDLAKELNHITPTLARWMDRE